MPLPWVLLSDKVTQLVTRPGDRNRDILLKRNLCRTFVACSIIVAPLPFVVEVGVMYTAGCITVSVVALISALFILFTNVPVSRVVEPVGVLVVASLIVIDWEQVKDMSVRAWPMIVPVIDGLLVSNCRVRVAQLAVLMLLLWLMVERFEASARVGIYEVGGRPDSLLCDCPEPPCSKSVFSACSSFVIIAFVVLSDYSLTRTFEQGMVRALARVDHCVELCERIATLLAAYSVDDAKQVVDENGERLPRRLRTAFEKLLDNLLEYRPYLPDSIMSSDEELFPDRDDENQAFGFFEGDASLSVRQPPPGVGEDSTASLCVCFTDIQSSTELWEACPTGMQQGLKVHNTVIRVLASVRHGYEVKTIGDAFMLVFGDAGDACEFGVEAQRSLVRAQWPPELLAHPLCSRIEGTPGTGPLWNGLRVRIGMHYGEARAEVNPITRRYDYFGPTVNTASRVESALRYGGLTGVTSAVLDALGTSGLARIGADAVHPAGSRELKGVREPVALFLLLPPELAERKKVADQMCVPQTESPVSTPAQGLRSGSTTTSGRNMVGLRVEESECGSQGSSESRTVSRVESHGSLRLQLNLKRRNAAVTAVRLTLGRNDPRIEVSNCAAAVERAAEMAQGTLNIIFSAVSLLTWNTARPCANPVIHCARFFAALGRLAGERLSQLLHCGSATGCVLSGNVAGSRRRHATVLGGCVELAAALAEEAELWGDHALAAGPVADYHAAQGGAHRAQVWHFGAPDAARFHTELVYDLPGVLRGAGDSKWDLLLNRSPGQQADGALQEYFEQIVTAVHSAGDISPILRELRTFAEVRPEAAAAVEALAKRAQRGAVRRRYFPSVWEARVGPWRVSECDGGDDAVSDIDSSMDTPRTMPLNSMDNTVTSGGGLLLAPSEATRAQHLSS
eukprot:TRINITY_DN4125_c0_g1_i1.p1 TRINITY_DN4125_c0_g1~~TRINITY_DN4125_c0_g1_i1.p1  ORF type:complete len:908 (+),score=107.30 TRINITY_DN4125_c0_g1_i1:86-2809(+)